MTDVRLPPQLLATVEVDVLGVDLLVCSLTDCRPYLPALAQAMTKAELERAWLLGPGAREAFVASRGLLRLLLAERLGVPRADIGFSLAEGGKPQLDAMPDVTEHWFNLSRSDDLVLFGISTAGEIGVDLERERPIDHLEDVAATVLDEREIALLERLPPDDRLARFLRLWTVKEAYLKAAGVGLRIAPREVGVEVGEDAQIVCVPRGLPDAAETRVWSRRHDGFFIAAVVLSYASSSSAALRVEVRA